MNKFKLPWACDQAGHSMKGREQKRPVLAKKNYNILIKSWDMQCNGKIINK